MPEPIKYRVTDSRKTMNGRYKAVTINIEDSIELEAVFTESQCVSIAALNPLNAIQRAAFPWACEFITENLETIQSTVAKWD